MQIAQVHRATLLNGHEVVVKVQHDGIKTIILEVCFFYPLGCMDIEVHGAFQKVFVPTYLSGLKKCEVNCRLDCMG